MPNNFDDPASRQARSARRLDKGFAVGTAGAYIGKRTKRAGCCQRLVKVRITPKMNYK
jgi:hypothetical protein